MISRLILKYQNSNQVKARRTIYAHATNSCYDEADQHSLSLHHLCSNTICFHSNCFFEFLRYLTKRGCQLNKRERLFYSFDVPTNCCRLYNQIIVFLRLEQSCLFLQKTFCVILTIIWLLKRVSFVSWRHLRLETKHRILNHVYIQVVYLLI